MIIIRGKSLSGSIHRCQGWIKDGKTVFFTDLKDARFQLTKRGWEPLD